jgi:hypothetical protein
MSQIVDESPHPALTALADHARSALATMSSVGPFAEKLKQEDTRRPLIGSDDYLRREQEPFVMKDALTSEQVELALGWMNQAPAHLRKFDTTLEDFVSEYERREVHSLEDALYERARLTRLSEIPQEGIHVKWMMFPKAEPWMVTLHTPAMRHFGVESNRTGGFFMRYFPGSSLSWHADRNVDIDPDSSHSTVSISVLLSEPGIDFTGGDFETPWGTVPLRKGDAVAITGGTRHRVTTVETGERSVLILFGTWWDPVTEVREEEPVSMAAGDVPAKWSDVPS